MRCLDATGEWQRVLDIANTSWPAISGNEGDEQMEEVPHSFSSMYITPRAKRKALKFCAQAAWRLGQWTELEKYATQLVKGNQSPHATSPATRLSSSTRSGEEKARVDYDGAFFTAVIHVHRKEWRLAAEAIDAARMAMDSRFTALMTESYKRAYPSMVQCQILAEMEEIISYRKLEGRAAADASKHPSNRPDAEEARRELLSIWRDRLAGCRVDADVHSPIMAVRSLILGPTDEVESTLTLSELSRQAHRFKLAERVVLDPLGELGAQLNGRVFGFGAPESLNLGLVHRDISSAGHLEGLIERLVTKQADSFLPQYGPTHHQYSTRLIEQAGGLSSLMIQHRLYFAFVKHLWSSDRRDEAMERLKRLSNVVDLVSHCENIEDDSMQVACWLELGEWKLEQSISPSTAISEQLQVEVLTAFKRATSSHTSGYTAWHSWALLNFRIAQQIRDGDDSRQGRATSRALSKSLRNHVVAAVNGFVKAISLGTKRWSASVQQDMLNLLTCLFKYGELSEVASTINEGIGGINLDTWLGVLPQLLARIHIREPSVRSVLHPLLTKLGEKHPQALMYPLSVLLKSPVLERKTAAESLMNSLKAHSSELVEEALMVSSELIRVAILWVETWHEGLEDASRLYFGDENVQGMLDVLLPLHEKVERGPETGREDEFIRSFGRDLAEAREYVEEYVRLVTQNGGSVPTKGSSSASTRQDQSGSLIRESEEAETTLNKAWDIYYAIFRRINKLLPQLRKLELSQCSPALSSARNLELGVPGSYRVDGSYVKIEQFIPNVDVITSKQRPRKITLRGSDGNDYVFLLKGHEDLRQDERVMQLFGLVNALLARDRQTKKQDLSIQRYGISPLSHDCGVVGWVPHCDTLHSLIRDYREGKIPLNMENRNMLSISPDYEQLTVMQKVEVFTEGLKRTTGNGNDLYEILWLKSTNSEEWLEHRTTYTRSLAVMSMVGYILGLGDRHPSNLMIDKLSGRVLHIDFGDCFEVAMHREKYPERIPFRLTRMLVKAMEVSGIEGSYRSTCERTMTVLRESRDSLVAMLEAFVYDPLISWRLVGLSESKGEQKNSLTIEELQDPAVTRGEPSLAAESGPPAELSSTVLHDSIAEGFDEDGVECEGEEASVSVAEDTTVSQRVQAGIALRARSASREIGMSASRARSLQMYSSMQEMAAANLAGSRIASIAGGGSEQAVADESLARSRIARSLRQREVMSLLEGQHSGTKEEFLNEKALKVIRRVQDKLSGTDFCDTDDPLHVPDQVQRLIVQATSTENLCQLFIGWCAFW
jgi:FKBP12-rapamycin complex-associated protein